MRWFTLTVIFVFCSKICSFLLNRFVQYILAGRRRKTIEHARKIRETVYVIMWKASEFPNKGQLFSIAYGRNAHHTDGHTRITIMRSEHSVNEILIETSNRNKKDSMTVDIFKRKPLSIKDTTVTFLCGTSLWYYCATRDQDLAKILFKGTGEKR